MSKFLNVDYRDFALLIICKFLKILYPYIVENFFPLYMSNIVTFPYFLKRFRHGEDVTSIE